MSFPRHRRSIIRWVLDRRPGEKQCPASPLPLIGVMSRSRLFLGGSLSSVARLRFAGRAQPALQWSCRSSISQRTVMTVLTRCASQGVNPTVSPTSLLRLQKINATGQVRSRSDLFCYGIWDHYPLSLNPRVEGGSTPTQSKVSVRTNTRSTDLIRSQSAFSVA
jgi:hypothetical protein